MSLDFTSLFTGMSERDIGYLLKTMVQKTINDELTNTEISSIDNKTPVLITNSKDVELVNDISLQSAINIETFTPYYMVEEPDGNNLKIWLKFHNVGELKDWSLQKNRSFSTGANTMPGLFSKYSEQSMMKYELYSYFNGVSHYAHTLDGPQVRILSNITDNKITSFFMRLIPISLAKVLYAENNSLFTKVDDDQLRYGYSVTIDSKGHIHFYVRNNYRQYHLWVKDAYNSLLVDPLIKEPQFRFENFNVDNFLTNYQSLCMLVENELPFHDWFFKYNPTTHAMTAINTSENNFASIIADTSLVTPVPVISCPIQEGQWTHSGTVQTTIYDNSGNDRNGTISNIATGGQWNNDNTLTSLGSNTAGTGDGLAIDWSSITALDTLTEFTISFWFNPLTEIINNKSYNTRLVTKGYAAANSVYIERRTGQNDIKFSFRAADNIEQTVTFSNPFPDQNKWYFVCARWKSGEKLKLTVNNVEVQSTSNITSTLSTAANTLKIFNATRAPVGIMTLLRIWNTQISDSVRDDLYEQGYHNPLFPKSENIQPVQEENPDPIFVPFTNVYTLDKMDTPAATDYRKINSLSGNSPFIQLHSVADGVTTDDPEVEHYNVPDGVTTGGDLLPFSEIYACTDPSNNSSSQLTGADTRTVVELQTGSSLIGKRVTKAIFYLHGVNTPVGTVSCKVWNSAGTLITTLWLNGTANTNLNAANVNTSQHTAYTFQNTDLTPWGTSTLAVGWRIGIEYTGGSGSDEIRVKRNRSNPRPNEWNGGYDGSWNTSVDDDDLVGNLYEGGTGSATVEPWHNLTANSQIVGELIGSTSALKTKKITRVRFKAKRNTAASSGTLHFQILTSTNTLKTTLTTWAVSSLSTATAGANLTWQNINQDITIEQGEKLILTCTSLPANSVVSIMTNNGNNTPTSDTTKNHNSTTSYLVSRTATGTWNNTQTSLDISGNIYSGGGSFDAFLRFDNTTSRVTTKIVNISSQLNNKKITKVLARLRKFGSPTGIMNCYIRDANDNIKVQYTSVDVNTLTTSYNDYEFVNVIHNYFTNNGGTTSGDKISFEYPAGNATNYVEINTNKDVFDGLNTITQSYGVNYTDLAQRDLAGKTFTGGEPDLNSRTRVVQSIEHQNSRLKGKKVTRVKVWLYRTTTATSGTAYCNIRGTNDILVKTLNTVAVSSLSTVPGTPSEITFTDITNNYPLNVGDKISIEFNGGSATDSLGVLVREVTPNYDGTNSIIRKYDEQDYDDAESTKDLCAVMDEGGFFYTPDPNTIPDPTPTNIKDLLYMSGNNAKSGFLEAFLMEFRIYTKDITLEMADNLYNNRYSISPVGNGQILMPFSLRPLP